MATGTTEARLEQARMVEVAQHLWHEAHGDADLARDLAGWYVGQRITPRQRNDGTDGI